MLKLDCIDTETKTGKKGKYSNIPKEIKVDCGKLLVVDFDKWSYPYHILDLKLTESANTLEVRYEKKKRSKLLPFPPLSRCLEFLFIDLKNYREKEDGWQGGLQEFKFG